jgi:hypothetical protein
VFLETDNHPYLFGWVGHTRGSDVGWSLYEIVDKDLTGFVLEIIFLERAKRRHIATGYDQSSEETPKRSIHRFHSSYLFTRT